VGGLDAGYHVQVTTCAEYVMGNDLDHEYPFTEINQKKKQTNKAAGP